MKITLITLVYNEQERLPFFLRHYNQFVDKIIVYLNTASKDKSGEILKNNPNTEIIPYDTGGFFSEEKNQEIKNTSWKNLDSDWFIVCDADEYLYCPKPYEMRSLLQSYLDDGITLPVLMGYQMIGDPLPKNDGKTQIYDHCKNGAEYDRLMDIYMHSSHKQIIFHPDSKVVYGLGAHTYVSIGRSVYSPDITLKMLHYRYFTLNYILDFYKYLNANPKDKHTSTWTRDENHLTKLYNWIYERRKKVIDEEVKMPKKIIIAGINRTGTTLLERGLNRHKDIVMMGELFHINHNLRYTQLTKLETMVPPLDKSINVELKNVWDSSESPSSYLNRIARKFQQKIFGCKILVDQLTLIQLDEVIRDCQVVLCMRHPLASYVSFMQSCKSGVFHANKGEKHKLDSVIINKDEFFRYYERVKEYHEFLIPRIFHVIYFHNLVLNYDLEIENILGKLELNIECCEKSLDKLNEWVIPDRIANWDEVKKWYPWNDAQSKGFPLI